MLEKSRVRPEVGGTMAKNTAERAEIGAQIREIQRCRAQAAVDAQSYLVMGAS